MRKRGAKKRNLPHIHQSEPRRDDDDDDEEEEEVLSIDRCNKNSI